jgi:hypothetical protein
MVIVNLNAAPGSMYSIEYALKEANRSDFIEERRRQLALEAEMEKEDDE